MFRQLEHAKHSKHAYEYKGADLVRRFAVTSRRYGDDCDEERQDGEQIEDVHNTFYKREFRRTRDESEDELDREQADADRLQDEEDVVVVDIHLVLPVGQRHVHADVAIERRERLDAEVHDGEEDAGDADDGVDACRQRRVGLLAEQPDALLPLLLRQLAHLLHHEALLLLVVVDDVFVDAVEDELLEEDVLRHLDRPPQPAAALVEVEDRLERRPVAVDEELVAPTVPELLALQRVAEQRVWEAVERAQLRLVLLPADVDDDALTSRLAAVVRQRRVDVGERRRRQLQRLRADVLVLAATDRRRHASRAGGSGYNGTQAHARTHANTHTRQADERTDT